MLFHLLCLIIVCVKMMAGQGSTSSLSSPSSSSSSTATASSPFEMQLFEPIFNHNTDSFSYLTSPVHYQMGPNENENQQQNQHQHQHQQLLQNDIYYQQPYQQKPHEQQQQQQPYEQQQYVQQQDRRDHVQAHCNVLGPISSECQPPYFPPPYNLTHHQQLDFHAAPPEPYPHFNSLGHGPQQYHQLHPVTAQTSSYDDSVRRNEFAYVNVRRPDVLHPNNNRIDNINNQELINCGAPQQIDGGLGSNAEHDSHNMYPVEHNSVIRKCFTNGAKRNSDNKEMVITGITAPTDVFCSVPGRLSLLSSTSKYKVTVGEVQRRLSPPECLNASLLGGVLRRAKSKNGGRSLREKLENIGLNLPAGRRKAANVTLLTSLVEGEALHLARDFGYVCETEFPSRQVAEYINRNSSDPADLYRRKEHISITKSVIKEIVDVLNQDRSPLCNNRQPILLDPNIQRNLTHFSLITHGFGSPAIAAALISVQNILNESIKHLDKQLASYQNASGSEHPANSNVPDSKKEIGSMVNKK